MKISGAAVGGLALGGLGFNLAPVEAQAQMLKIRWAKETTTICPYCAVGCGIIVHTSRDGSGKIINTEGDPDHPINQGSLCAKGAALYQLVTTESRIKRPLYRAPYSDEWVEMSWEQALSEIARRVKQSRDSSFTTNERQGPGGQPNRWHCPCGQRRPGQRGVLGAPGDDEGSGSGLH